MSSAATSPKRRSPTVCGFSALAAERISSRLSGGVTGANLTPCPTTLCGARLPRPSLRGGEVLPVVRVQAPAEPVRRRLAGVVDDVDVVEGCHPSGHHLVKRGQEGVDALGGVDDGDGDGDVLAEAEEPERVDLVRPAVPFDPADGGGAGEAGGEG